MHALTRCTPRSWATATCTTKAKVQTFSTCRRSMDDDRKRSILPYHSVGWVSMDLQRVKHEPWMKVKNAPLSEDEKIQRRQDRLKRERREKKRETKRRKKDEAAEVCQVENLPSVLQAPFSAIAQPDQRKVTTLPGALTLAKSSSGLRRTIGRDLLPPLRNGLPAPATKPIFSKRPKLFVPITPSMGRRDYERLEGPSSSDWTRGQPVRPHPLDANGDKSLEDDFVEQLRGESAVSYQLDLGKSAQIPQRRRKAPESISGRKHHNDDKSSSGGDSEDEYVNDGADDRPDFIPVHSSRLPRGGSISSLPQPADVVLQSSDSGLRRPLGSSRLWRTSPVILKRMYGNQGHNG